MNQQTAPLHDNNSVPAGFAPSGRDLYMAYINDQPGHVRRFAPWCELDDIEQNAWMAKARGEP